MSDDERRRAYRFAARIKVRFRSIEELVTAYTEDVSRGGLYVTAAQQLPPGTEVQLSLELPDGGEPALVPARVAYLLDEPTARAQGRNPGMGMQFLEDHVTPLAERIARFLADTIGSGQHERPGPIHALVVDNSASYRELVARSLEDAGHHVTVAENGLEAFGKAMQRAPDIVLTDVTMPVMDGWQLLRLLRGRDATKKVPVVFLTSLDSERDRIKGYQRGVDDYIAKPFAGAELVARVLRIVTRSRWEGVLHDPGDRTTMTGDLRQASRSTRAWSRASTSRIRRPRPSSSSACSSCSTGRTAASTWRRPSCPSRPSRSSCRWRCSSTRAARTKPRAELAEDQPARRRRR